MDGTISVLVADDHIGFATACSQVLRQWYEVLPPVNTIPQLKRALAEAPRPRVVLLDLQFGQESALRHVPGLAETFPEVALVIHSGYWTEVLVDAALAAGACGYVDKCCGFAEVRSAVEQAVRGGTPIFGPTDVSPRRRVADVHPHSPFTRKQRQLLGLLQQGLSREEIARRLRITLSGVDAAKGRLRRACGFQARERVPWNRVAKN